MKGIRGLIIAIGLGIAGFVFNYAYLMNKSRELESVAFVGVRADATVNRGERLLDSHLDRIEIPRSAVRNLEKFAIPWSARTTVVNQNVWRTLEGGSLLLRDDLKTPPPELTFGQNSKPGAEEFALGVPIDTRKMVSALVAPGDEVSFVVSRGGGFPTLAGGPPTAGATGGSPGLVGPLPAPATPAATADDIKLIGPFTILSLGNRLGSSDVMQAARKPLVQENVMMVLVRKEGVKLDPEAVKLLRLLAQTEYRPLGYLLHPRKPKAE